MKCSKTLAEVPYAERRATAYRRAAELADEDVQINLGIGRNGLALIEQIAAKEARRARQHPDPLQCGFAGDGELRHGHVANLCRLRRGIPLHVYVDDAAAQPGCTADRLGTRQPPHAHAGGRQRRGHMMQHGMVDMVIVGTDRTTASGDVSDEIRTYLKALAAHDYITLPSPTIDWSVNNGLKEIPIEQRSADEVSYVQGRTAAGEVAQVRISPDGTDADELRLRRDAGAAGQRADHRAGSLRGFARGAEEAVPAGLTSPAMRLSYAHIFSRPKTDS